MSKPAFKVKSRTKAVQTQVALSFVFKGISIGLNFFVVPITLSLLNNEKYGIWITLQSFFSWITLFDIGIGNGLRNKLTVAIADNDLINAKKIISTGYFIIALLGICFIAIVLVSINLVNWQSLFKNTLLNNDEYKKLVALSMSSLIMCFILGLINQIFNAFQKNSYTNLISITSNSIFIILVIIFRSVFHGNLLLVATVYCGCLIVSHLLITIIFFIYHRQVVPGIHYIELSKIGDILKLGGQFFVIQIAVLFIFSIDNFLILQLLGPSFVTQYNVVYRLFSIFTIGFGILLGPLWSAFTEAHVKNDAIWIKAILKNLQLALIPLVFLLIVFSVFFNKILTLWIPNKSFDPPPILIASMAIFVFISIWNNVFSFYLNGISETRAQVFTAVIGGIINVPLAIVLVKFTNLGLTGVVFAMSISLSLFSIIGPIVTYRKLGVYGK